MATISFAKSKRTLLLCGMLLFMLIFAACGDDDPFIPTPTPTSNDAVMILDKDKREMIYSLVDLEGNKGRIYEMTYTVDYELDEALKYNIDGTDRLKMFVAEYLMDTVPPTKDISLFYSAGCSAFACPDESTGDYQMGRNFDFNHFDPDTKERIMIPAIVVHTAPKGGKKSVSFVDGQFVDYKSGFYTDGESDLSMLIALPYLLLDGINEDGFAVSVLKLDGLPTQQQDLVESKNTIFTSVAMRMLLDRAGSVKEAVGMLRDFNMCMDKDTTASYHFFMADATGDYAIVEYTNPDISLNPDTMEVLNGVDTLRCTTNFYVSPTMIDTPYGYWSTHGKERYDDLRDGLYDHNYKMTPEEAMDLLRVVAQGPYGDQSSTGFTQWSELFNLSQRRVTMSILREWDKRFEFGIE